MLAFRPSKRAIGPLIAISIIPFAIFALFHWHYLDEWRSDSTASLRKLNPFHFGSGGNAPPDPTKEPGWRVDEKWLTSNPSVQIHDWTQKLKDRQDGVHMNWARNKTVLLLGDSVLRDMISLLCESHLHGEKALVSLNKTVANEKTQGWECVVPHTGTRLINGFLYGMTNYSRYPSSDLISHEWPPGPWGYEDRIPDLAQQYARYDPEMVVFNTAPWDFKFMFRRDVHENRKAIDIEPDELHEYGERLRECLRMLRAAFPKKKLIFVQVHPFGENDIGARWFWAKGISGGHDYGIDFSPKAPNETAVKEKLPDLFTRRRVSQLASTYRRIAAEEQYDDLDYWKMAASTETGKFIRAGDAVHPSDASMALMLEWVFEKLWRWEIYRV